MTRVHLATAFLLSIAGLAALAPHPALARPQPEVAQWLSSPEPTDGVTATWLRGGPPQANVCKPGTICCFFVMPHVCGLCSTHC